MFSTGLRSGALAGTKCSCAKLIPSRSGFDAVLWRITILQKNISLWVSTFLNMLAKSSPTNEETILAFILPWYCSAAIIPFPYAITTIKRGTFDPGEVSNIHSFAFRSSFSSETKIKYLSGLDQATSPGALPWLKVYLFLIKNCSIQIKSYILLPKVSRKFTMNFLSKPKPQFQVIFGKDSFPLNTAPFQASLSQNSINPLLANEWWNAYFYHYSFYTKVFTLLARAWFVVIYFSFFWLKVLVVFPDYVFVNCPQVFNIPFHMPADGCFWIIAVSSQFWYFWIRLWCILMNG